MQPRLTVVVALVAALGCAPAVAKDVVCVQGAERPQSTFQKLTLSITDSVVQALAYRNEMGPSLSGAFFGCALNADRSRRNGAEKWEVDGLVTSITLDNSVDASAGPEVVTITNAPLEIEVSFAGSPLQFCGAQSGLPERIFFDKASGKCVFDGPVL